MKTLKITSILILTLLLGCLVVACGSNAPASQVDTQPSGNDPQNSQASGSQNPQQAEDPEEQEEDQPPSMEEIHAAWQASSHAKTFTVDGNGQNNTCAQCHAPVNWLPSMDSIPETCLTCKFELEDPPPYIPEENWENIPCKVCHELNKKDVVQPEYIWLEIAAIDEYSEVESTTELCLKCHISAEAIEGHDGISVQGTHQDQTCTSCHDPHGTKVECASCHTDLDFSSSEIVGHDQDHLDIACLACHDNSGLAVDLDPDSNTWQVFQEAQDGTLFVGSSHNIALEVTCTRCHFSDNPWGLSTQP